MTIALVLKCILPPPNIVLARLTMRVNPHSWILTFVLVGSSSRPTYSRIRVHTAPKWGSESLRYVTRHFRDRRGAASFRYRNLAEITVLTVWFSSPRKSYPMIVNIALGLISTVAQFFREKARKIYVRKWNIGSVGKATRKRRSWARFNFYVFAWPSTQCLYFIYARKNYATVEIHDAFLATHVNARKF